VYPDISQATPSIAARQAPASIKIPLTVVFKVLAASAVLQSYLEAQLIIASTSKIILSNYPAAFTVALAPVPTLNKMSASCANCPASAMLLTKRHNI